MSSSKDNRPFITTSTFSSTQSSPVSTPLERRQSSSTSSQTSPRLSPRVQVVPHARTISYDMPLSDVERALLDKANFDVLDLSSQDFDFEDIFTYDKPQKKLTKVMEVSSSTRERDWSSFSFSHYSSTAASTRQKAGKSKVGISEMYLRNQQQQHASGKK